MCLTSQLFDSIGGCAKMADFKFLWGSHLQYLTKATLCCYCQPVLLEVICHYLSSLWVHRQSVAACQRLMRQPILELFCLLLLQTWEDTLFLDETHSFATKHCWTKTSASSFSDTCITSWTAEQEWGHREEIMPVIKQQTQRDQLTPKNCVVLLDCFFKHYGSKMLLVLTAVIIFNSEMQRVEMQKGSTINISLHILAA